MTAPVVEPAHRLRGLAARRLRERALGLAAAALGAGVLAGVGVGALLGATTIQRIALGIVVVAVIVAAGLALARRRPVDARVVARHLDRVVPALEESTELLLVPEDELALVPRLQRRRTADALAGLETLPVPRDPMLRNGAVAGLAMLVAGLLLASPAVRSGTERTLRAAAPSPGAPRGLPRAVAVEIGVTPPAYTRRPPRRVTTWDLEAEAGARVTWSVTTEGGADAVELHTAGGDTIRLARGDDGRFTGGLVAERSTLYQVVARRADGGTSTSEFHRLGVRPDAPPSLTVVTPEPRTELPATGPARVPVLVLASDDYGVAATRIVATLTTGRGEGVKFRERVLDFDGREPRDDGGLALRATLDLRALGLGPGDELYFHVVATDTRRPTPNEGRSETIFVAVADTAQRRVADFSGIAVNRLPEYFRSQRQIIIDTERLLRDRPRISVAEFRRRSNEIGIDQHLLRVRYGELVGDEEAEDGPGAGPGHGEPAHAGAAGAADDPAAGLRHEHDTEENATRLAGSVKATLRAAVGHMWESERRLRTYEPKAALPFEYRALELLKQVQEDSRAYVQRVGFEPPPLEPDRLRLTGELDSVRTRTVDRTVRPAPTAPEIRAGLRALAGLEAGSRADALRDTLEAAGRAVARLAVDQPAGHLETLRALRGVITSLAPDSPPCTACLERARAGLWAVLASPKPAPEPRRPGDALTRRYLELLREEP